MKSARTGVTRAGKFLRLPRACKGRSAAAALAVAGQFAPGGRQNGAVHHSGVTGKGLFAQRVGQQAPPPLP